MLLWLAACSEDAADTAGKGQVVQDGDLGLELVLDVDSSVAGTPIGWTAIVHRGDGTTETVEGAVLSSDLESSLRLTDTTVTPVVAGIQTLTATWVNEDEQPLAANAWVNVSPGEAASLALSLSASQTAAGTPVSISAAAQDRYGNVVDTAATAYVADASEALVVPPNVVSTVPGTYTITGTLGSATDAVSLRVVAGEPVGLELSLSKTDLELYETTVATIDVVDVYGNKADVDADLWVEGEGTTVVAAHDITFYDEGSYYVYASYADMQDLVGPILVDSTGPVLTVDQPDRGDMVEGYVDTASGTCVEPYSSLDGLTVNGEPVTVADDGTWSTDLDYVFGVNVIETAATDSDGNETVDTRAVMAGDYWTYGTSLDNGLVARLNQQAFDEIELVGESLINGTDLTTLVPSPAYSNYSESCIDVIFDEICIEWYSIALYVTNPSIGGTDLEIDPTSGGYLDASFTVYTPSIDWSADGAVLGIGMSADGSIYADWIKLQLQLQPYVSGGVLGVNVLSADYSSSGFYFDWDSWLYDIMEFFGVDLSGLLEGYLEGAVEDLLTTEIPALLADAVGDLEISYPIDLGDDHFQLDAVPASVSVDDDGLTLGLGTTFTTTSWDHAETGPGSLYAGYTIPAFEATPGMEVSVSLDFVNQLFYAFWGSGILDMTMTSDDLGLDLSSIGPYLGFTDLTIATYAEMPPVVIPGDAGTTGELQIGDLRITIYDGPADPANIAYDVYATVFAPFDLSATDGMLSPTIGDPEIWFDVVTPANNTVYSEDVETLLAALIPLFMPQLTGALGTIPIPDIEGFPLSIDGIESDGGWVTIGGDLHLDSLSDFGFGG